MVEAARQRLINSFSNGVPVYLSMSAGKDSICVADLVYQLIQEQKIDPKILTVYFVDEEAVFDEVDRIAQLWRRKFLEVGAQFIWWCIEVKHFNCFNMLTNDESFICWDSTCPDRWVRPIKPYAVTDHPMLRRRDDSYQTFLKRVTKDGLNITGLRMSESLQRLTAFSPKNTNLLWPIYDWRDTDVWRYIRDRNLDFPNTYLDLYTIGTARNRLRISQFFSVDTAKVLVRLSETDPDLMEKVIRREPNAYLASLYWDSEMFRTVRSKRKKAPGKEDEVDLLEDDPRAKVFEFLNNRDNYSGKVRLADIKTMKHTIYKFQDEITDREWRKIYAILVGGDPKHRASRALNMALGSRRQKGQELEAARRGR